jgi:lysophospholipase L1-like esterase
VGVGVLVGLVLAIAVAGIAAVLVVAFIRFQSPPRNRPDRYVVGAGSRPRVVCLGASTIHGNMSYNIVDELARRLPDHDLINAGINGQRSEQILARLPAVVRCQPDVVVVHAGANDLLAVPPDMDALARNLAAIVAGLRPTGARVALLTLQPVGERLDDAINLGVGRANEVITRVAAETGATLIDLNASLTRILRASGGPGTPAVLPAPIVRAMVLHCGLGIGLDQIGRWNRFHVHSDGLHLNSAGGRAPADLVEAFVRG